MRNMVFLVVMCSIAHPALAERIPDAPAKAAQVQAGSQLVKSSTQDSAVRHVPVIRDAPVMQKTGSRQLDDGVPTAVAMQKVVHPSPVAIQSTPETLTSDEQRPRTKTAMLIAALAVMLTIALRRGGASDR